jgi:hypothetical protein
VFQQDAAAQYILADDGNPATWKAASQFVGDRRLTRS